MHDRVDRGRLGERVVCSGSSACCGYRHYHQRHVLGMEYCRDTGRLIINMEEFPNVKRLECSSCAHLAIIASACELYSEGMHGLNVTGVVLVNTSREERK